MKTKVLFLSLFLGCFLTSFAQEVVLNGGKTAGYKTPFLHNSAGSNWFIQLGAGAQTIFGDHDADAKMLDRITVMPTVSVGKWFSPYWGVRVKGQGGALHGFENKAAYMQHIHYYNVHLDAMWNLANYWGVYSPKKVFNFTPYVGLGFGQKLAYDKDVVAPVAEGVSSNYHEKANVLTVNGGLQFGFRLSNRINLDFDLGATVVPDYFDRVVQGKEYDLIAAASGGFTFKLGKTSFEEVIPYDADLVNGLNSRINELRNENEVLSRRPVSCPECPKAAPTTVVKEVNYVPNVVFFRFNSAKIDDNQQISIYNTAEFMKANKAKIKVIGYADKKTGSKEYNLKLSEKRAKAVANELTAKYGISAQDITVAWDGDSVQPYGNNDWNRVVIMTTK
ncbi:MAG: OmpA family protein [Dysgonamonadaceae bacterium]|jgi:outer membrane protein OmpA-like peptidoglycan-associated protein|nr:OmpA family protein [Dysgonamonadaceae bacterium]